MSVVSLITYNKIPFIVADLAISGPRRKSVILPSTNREADFSSYSGERMPNWFGLKTFMVKEKLYIGFVGIVSDLTKAQFDVEEFFRNREVNLQTFDDMLAECEFEKYIESSFLFVLGRPDISPNSTSVVQIGKWSRYESQTDFTVSSAGSGSISWNTECIRCEEMGFNGPPTLGSYIQRALSTCMRFLSYERRTCVNLAEGWGGGFDLAYYSNGKFQKVNDVAYIFWYAEFDKPVTHKLISVIHNSYEDGFMILRNSDHEYAKAYAIREVADLRIALDPYPVLFQVKHVVSCIHLLTSSGKMEDLIVNHQIEYHPKAVEVLVDKERLAFKFSDYIKSGLTNAITEAGK